MFDFFPLVLPLGFCALLKGTFCLDFFIVWLFGYLTGENWTHGIKIWTKGVERWASSQHILVLDVQFFLLVLKFNPLCSNVNPRGAQILMWTSWIYTVSEVKNFTFFLTVLCRQLQQQKKLFWKQLVLVGVNIVLFSF